MSQIDGIILNPKARGGTAGKLWRDLLSSISAKDLNLQRAKVFDVSEFQTGELKKWAQARIQEGGQNFIVVGGDGTVHLAINAFDGLSIRLGAIGLGSSNDFHKPAHTKGRKKIGPFHCRLDFENAVQHDLGEVKYSNQKMNSTSNSNRILFAVNSSLGFTAEANYNFNSHNLLLNAVKRRSTDAAIGVVALQEFLKRRTYEVEFALDQAPRETLSFINIGIVKNNHFAGDFRYDISQSADDGKFGFHVCRAVSRYSLAKVFYSLSHAQGKFSEMPGTYSKQCNEVSLFSKKPLALETDGEVTQITQAQFKVLPRRMYLCP